MKNERIEFLDGATKISVVVVDCLDAAVALARGHLSGPVASGCLAQALAAVSLLGAECSLPEETVTLRLDCSGPLEGFLVECTSAATLRGYTKKKVLDELDGLGTPSDVKAFGDSGTFELIRSVPGSILASGAVACAWNERAVAPGLDTLFAQSLQRRVRTAVYAVASDDGEPVCARALLAECSPDGDEAAFAAVAEAFASGVVDKALSSGASERTLLKKLGLSQAEKRKSVPVAFACRCSAERASAMIAALPPDERANLPATVDITCHLCGRTWSVRSAE